MSAPTSSTRAVAGVALEPGERVLVWRIETGHAGKVAAMIVLGLLTAIAVVGLLFLYKAITYKSSTVYHEVVTDKRLIQVKGDGSSVSVPFGTITQVTTVKRGASVSHVIVASRGAPTLTFSTTQLQGPSNPLALADFLRSAGDAAFLARVTPFGRATSVA